MSRSTSALPLYHCEKIDRPLVLSGAMDDLLWSKAETAELTDIHGRPGRFRTVVRLLYDDQFLYVGFDCQDDYVWGTITGRNGAIWEEECIEIFLNPGNTIHQYYEINLSPLNTLFDACILNGRTETNPDAPFIGFPDLDFKEIKTRVKIAGELNKPGAASGWCAEFAIPFKELFGATHIPPRKGDIWRANFYRIDQPQDSEPEQYAWSRTDRVAFHLPWRFGKLEFL